MIITKKTRRTCQGVGTYIKLLGSYKQNASQLAYCRSLIHNTQTKTSGMQKSN